MKKIYALNEINTTIATLIDRNNKTRLVFHGKTFSPNEKAITTLLLEYMEQFAANTYIEQKVYYMKTLDLATTSWTEICSIMKGKNFNLFEIGKGLTQYAWPVGDKLDEPVIIEKSATIIELKFAWIKQDESDIHKLEPTDEDFNKLENELAELQKTKNKTKAEIQTELETQIRALDFDDLM